MCRSATLRRILQDIPMTLHTAPAAIPSSAEQIVGGFALALGGSLLLAVSAKVQVPFYPVPLTLQTLVVLLLGATLGARIASASVALYLIEGLAGLPVFAGAAAGPLYMAGPTGGFLAGFLAAAALIGFAADRRWDRSWIRLLGSLSLGHAVVFAFGFLWLAQFIGAEKAFAAGVAPFALATILKTLLAVALVGAGRRAAGRLSRA
jgi:biotin transport system substrate-specific component